MKALVDYDSDGHSERDYTNSEPPDEPPGQPQMLEDIDAIIRETRAEMEQARLKADQLICQFAETYVETAGQFREVAIQRYRGRLEGLPAEVCAKVCETLAKDDIFCCNMEFGNGHLSYGGMSFTYKVESDAAFNTLSHHAWKDLHQFFVKNGSSLPSGNAMEQGRPPVAHMIHSDDDDDDGLESHKDKLASSSEESGSSSDEEDSLSSADSTRASHTGNRQRGRSSFSPSPDWATEDDAGSSDAPKRRGPGRPRKHQGKSDAPDKRGHEPWSVEEEALIRETMAMQLQMKGNLGFSRKTAMKLLEVFPRRTTSAIKNKWLGLKLKDIWGDWGEAEGKVQARDAKGKVRIEDPDPRKHYEGDSGSMTVYNDADEDRFDDSEVKPGSHEMNSWIKNRWTPEQDRLLTKRMHSEMQSAGVATMSVPKTVMKELGRSFGRKEKSISRRWSYLSGNSTWGGSDKRKKTKRVVGSILARIEPQGEESAPASQQAREDRPTKENRLLQWSPQEIETLDRLTKGIDKAADIDFKEILHQMPDPSRRTVAGCNVFWRRHIQPSRIPRDKNPIHDDEALGTGSNSSSKFDLPKQPKKSKKRGPKPSSDFESSKHSKKAKRGSKSKLLQSETVEDTSHRSSRWTREEDDLLWRLAGSRIPWRAVAAQIPHRSESACQLRYSLHLVKMPEYQERLKGQPARPIRRRAHSRRDAKLDRDSPEEGDTVISVARRAKHSRESGDEGEKRSAARRKKHGGANAQSSLHRRDHDDDSEVEDSDVYMYDFE